MLSLNGLKACIRSSKWLHAVRPSIQSVREKWFDIQFNVHTAGKISTRNLQVASSNQAAGIDYEVTDEKVFRQAMAELIQEQTDLSHWTFLDVGCGKGKAILLASEHPFRKIIGIDYSPLLVETAKKNIEGYRNPRQVCRHLEVACHDALEYEIPRGPLLVYMFHPFEDPVMSQFIERLERASRRSGDPVCLIYMNPELHRLVEGALTGFEVVGERQYYAMYRRSRTSPDFPAS